MDLSQIYVLEDELGAKVDEIDCDELTAKVTLPTSMDRINFGKAMLIIHRLGFQGFDGEPEVTVLDDGTITVSAKFVQF